MIKKTDGKNLMIVLLEISKLKTQKKNVSEEFKELKKMISNN